MKPNKPGKKDRKHPDVARDAMEDIKVLSGAPNPLHNDIHYMRTEPRSSARLS